MHEEKRKQKRRHLIYYLKVFNEKNDLLGHLADITTEGIMLFGKERIPLKKKFKLRMDLPLEFQAKKQLEFEAQSLWCKPSINPDFLDTGFLITKVHPENIELIEQLIDFLGFFD